MLNEADTRAKLIDPRLHLEGWDEGRIVREYYFTEGRIVLVGDGHRRQEPKKADYLLRYSDSFPIATLEAKDESHSPGAGLQQAKEYAQTMELRFAYSSNGHGIEEYDFVTNVQRSLDRFPSPDELWARLTAGRPTSRAQAANPLLTPYHREIGGKTPRYYQEIAINRVVEAVLRDQKRILITMATGTGKTYVAFQVAWKLVKPGTIRRVLFLADRNVLRDQAYNTFAPFEDARGLIEEGQAPKSRDIYFSIYQAMYSGEEGKRLYQRYPRGFFDLIIIDECHRSGFGTWNAILQHFDSALQLGMTATPKRDDNVDTYEYFGEPVYTYSLAQGIDDGFLAVYKVHRVQTNVDANGLPLGDQVYTTPDFERVIRLPDRTETIATHLAHLLRETGRMEKTMVFCVDMEHAAEMTRWLSNLNADLGIADYCVRIVSEEGPVGRRYLEQFQDKDRPTPVIATTVDLLTTGVDAPSVRNVVFVKPIASQVVFKQIVGRGSRLCEDTDKYWFRVVDYTGCTRLFEDPEFDGFPEAETEEQIVAPKEVEVLRDKPEAREELKPEKRPQKIRLEGITVTIAAETYLELDATGRRLTVQEYVDYTRSELLQVCGDLFALQTAWTDRQKRGILLRRLQDKSILVEALAILLKKPDADGYDLLAHLAFGQKVHSRDERAKALRNLHQQFFAGFTPEAREVLEALVEKYRLGGITELDKPEVFNVSPFDRMGGIIGVAHRFGGIEELTGVVGELQRRVYEA